MKRLLHLGAGACAFLLALAVVSAGGGPTTVSFQGLLTENGAPVPDGTYTIGTGLWGQIVGGANLGSDELHVVTTKDGMFTIELNESGTLFANCAPCDAYLQVEVLGPGGFVPLSPRTHLTAVMHALTASAMYGEDTSGGRLARGTVKVINPGTPALGYELVLSADLDADGHPDYAVVDSATTSGARRMAVADVDGDGVADRSVDMHINDDRSFIGLREYNPLLGYNSGDITLQTDSGGSSIGIKAQGTSEALISLHGASTSMRYKTYQPGQPIYGNVMLATSDSGAGLDLTHVGADGESGMRAKNIRKNISVTLFKSDKSHAARMAVDSGFSEMVLEADPDADGIAQQSVKARITDRALLGLKNYNPLLAYTPGDDVILQTDDDESSIALTRQGAPDEVKILVVDDAASMNMKHYQPGQPYYGNIAMEATDSGAALDVTNLNDGGESGMKVKAHRKDISVTIKSHPTKGPIAHFGVDSVRALTSVEADPDGDGDQSGVRADAIETRSILKTYFEAGSSESRVMDSADADGAHTSAQASSTGGGCTMQCDVGYHRADFYVHRSVPEPGSTTLQVAEAVTIQTLPDTARLSITAGEVLSGNHRDGWNLLQADGTCFMQGTAGGRSSIFRCSDASCSMVMVDGTLGVDDTGLVIDGTGDGKIGLGVSNPTEPIEHSSGAHLTAGGVWSNASDAALKENFQPVDGNDLLERIDKLQITRWNYRNESDDVTHIGPTAQDFKHLFGVGDNDRSISTVDPSGIALAAIQVLHRENDELREQNLELKNRLDELNRKLDRVLSRQ